MVSLPSARLALWAMMRLRWLSTTRQSVAGILPSSRLLNSRATSLSSGSLRLPPLASGIGITEGPFQAVEAAVFLAQEEAVALAAVGEDLLPLFLRLSVLGLVEDVCHLSQWERDLFVGQRYQFDALALQRERLAMEQRA